jgi:hypothetical protein
MGIRVEWDDRYPQVGISVDVAADGSSAETVIVSVFELRDLIDQLTGVADAAEV